MAGLALGSPGIRAPPDRLADAHRLETLVHSVEKVELPEMTEPNAEQAVKRFPIDGLPQLGIPFGGR